MRRKEKVRNKRWPQDSAADYAKLLPGLRKIISENDNEKVANKNGIN
jgi:hypothetical protein